MKPWKWTKAKAEAAILLAEDRLTDAAIAARVGKSRPQLARWKHHPEFAARVAALIEVIDTRIMANGIARRVRRIERLHDHWDRMQQVIAERAADPAMQPIPGGKTGLLVIKDAELVMEGPEENRTARVIPVKVAVDTALLRELREHEKQTAIELGQWSEKHELSAEQLNRLVESELARLAGVGQTDTAGTPPPDADARPEDQSAPD